MVQIIELEEKHPSEVVEYQLDLSKNTAFSSGSDTLDQDAAWYIYDEEDKSTNLAATMIEAYDYVAASDIIKCTVKLGTNAKTYLLVGIATISASSRAYIVIGRFKVRSLGLAPA